MEWKLSCIQGLVYNISFDRRNKKKSTISTQTHYNMMRTNGTNTI